LGRKRRQRTSVSLKAPAQGIAPAPKSKRAAKLDPSAASSGENLLVDDELARCALKEDLAGALTRASALFAKLDADSNGKLEKAEFRRAVRTLELSATDAVCDGVFDEYDADASGSIDYNEWVRYTLRDALCQSAGRVTDIFHSWDRDGSGLIGKAEFRRAIRAVGFDMPTAELDALFDEIDADGSGQIEFGELDGHLRSTLRRFNIRGARHSMKMPHKKQRSHSVQTRPLP